MRLINLIFKVQQKARLFYKRDCRFDVDSKVESGSVLFNTILGRHSYIGYDSTVINASIGRFCSIANRVTVGGAMHPMHFVSTSPVFLSHRDSVKAKFATHDYLPVIKTVIGHDVWIGEGAFVKAGVTVGNGAVIGMGAVVTKDVPPYAIVAGNPAKLIRFRFEESVVDALIETAWWDWSEEKLLKYGEFMNDPIVFLKRIKEG